MSCVGVVYVVGVYLPCCVVLSYMRFDIYSWLCMLRWRMLLYIIGCGDRGICCVFVATSGVALLCVLCRYTVCVWCDMVSDIVLCVLFVVYVVPSLMSDGVFTYGSVCVGWCMLFVYR